MHFGLLGLGPGKRSPFIFLGHGRALLLSGDFWAIRGGGG
jgi:hypothetical protein